MSETKGTSFESTGWEAETPAPVSWRSIADFGRGLWQRLSRAAIDTRVMTGLLLAILLLASVLRLTGLDWDEHQHLHPDERFLTMVENSLQWPKSFKEYWDTSVNPLNPYNHDHGTYVYGLSPLILAKFLGQITGKTGYDGVYLVGRAMSAVMDMLCIMLVFLLGRRLYDARVGLLGAFLLSVTVLDIQQSHYFTVDTTTTFFVTLALYFAVRVAQGGRWGSIVMLGVAFGLAVSAKISVLSFLLIIGLAYLLRMHSAWLRDASRRSPFLNWRAHLGQLWMSFKVESEPSLAPVSALDRALPYALRAATSLLVVLVVAVLVFRIAQPQAFTGPGFFDFKLNPQWKQDMTNIQRTISGQMDYPPSHQWTAREPVWYMFKNLVQWGMGLPLGLTVWAAWALMAYELYKKHKWQHLLPWVWMTFTFFYQSVQFVKTVRYLLPIYPTMALMAGYGLIWLWDWGRRQDCGPLLARVRGLVRPLALGLIVAVLVGTTLWALAFTSIYTRPVSRITASRWIYANIPPGSSISFEVWDDPLPLNIDGHNAGNEYRHIRWDPYWEDIPQKRDELYSWIEQTEYIVLSSNRLYGSIPRLPMRYPMTTRYYEALFSGELGYDLIATFTSRPRLFGIEVVDDDADESFTVYDHPKVLVFKKRADFSMDNVHALLGGYDLERIVRVTPLQVTKAPNNLMLDRQTEVLQRAGGTWSEIFQRDSLTNRLPTLSWLVVLFLLGWVTFPLGFVAFQRLRDRGYLLNKTLGLLLLGYGSWLVASVKLLPYTRATIAFVLLALIGVSGAVAWVQRHAIRDYLRLRWRLLLVNDLLFLIFFGVFWLIRWANPDLWHPVMGGEKPMDFAYLNAIIKSTYFPPYDPWFAGGYINYYYFGWVLVATLIKLTGIVPWVAYNLAIPTFFALTAMGVSSVVFNLIPAEADEERAARRWFPRALRFGLVGALLATVAGNLGELQLVLNGLRDLGQHVTFTSTIPGLATLVKMGAGLGALLKGQALPFRPEWWYWNASRVMQHGEINEFPFFTFLYADLHAHLTALPVTVLALGLITALVARPVAAFSRLARNLAPLPFDPPVGRWQALRARWQQVDWAAALRLTFLALVLGELWCNNTWDYPTYLGLAVVALGIETYTRTRRIDQASITRFVLSALFVLVLSRLLYQPYHAHFGSAYSSAELWKGERTALGAYLIIHGTALFILASYLLTLAFGAGARNGVARVLRLLLRYSGARRRRAWHFYGLLVRGQTAGFQLAWIGLILLALVLLLLLGNKAWIPLLGLPLLVLAVALTLERRATPERRLQTLLIATGLALTLAVEYIVLKGDIGRMNTVFKFYLQVWILWAVAAAVALAYLARRWGRWPQTPRVAWRTALVVLLVGVSLYPVLATRGKIRDRWYPDVPRGLDGMQYMTVAHYNDNGHDLTLSHDYQAIRWMQDHIQGSPVIVEANTPLYRWGGRISIYTGLPSVIGWDWHQKQQRAALSGEVVDWRLQDVSDLYNTTDVAQAARILTRYQVSYVYVGELEQAYYAPEGLAKFEQMVGSTLDIAYREGPVTLYRVRDSGASELAQTDDPGGSVRGLLGWVAQHWIGGAVKAQEPEKPTGEAPATPGRADLLLDQPVEQLPVLTDRGWNPLARGSTWGALLSWWLVLELIGLAAWPLARRVFAHFRDGGYALAKGLGLLVVSYLVWMSASLRLAINSPPTAWLALLALGGLSFF